MIGGYTSRNLYNCVATRPLSFLPGVSWSLIRRSFGMTPSRPHAVLSRVTSKQSILNQKKMSVSNSLQYDGSSRTLQVRWKGGYSDFGHNPKSPSLFTVLWTAFLMSVMIGVFIDWKMLWEIIQDQIKPPKVDAAKVQSRCQ